MRLLILFSLCALGFVSYAQTPPAVYAARWKVIDSLFTKKGLTATALGEVNKLYALARQEKNEPQTIKALVYKLSLEESESEDGMVKAIKELEADAAGSSQPERSILENMLAGLYLQYLQQVSWKIRNRSNTGQASGPDITTWTTEQLGKKITGLYLASLQDETLLLQINVEQYAPVFIKGNATRLRPSLFDLLAHQALDYFMSGGYYYNGQGNGPEFDDPLLFTDAAGFAHHRFSHDDSTDLKYQALLLYQRLIRLHLADKAPSALVDVDIQRLMSMHSGAIVANKDELYQQALRRITDRYDTLPAAADAWALQATDYVSRADNPVVPADSDGYRKARVICEKVLAEKEVSSGQATCSDLLHTILQQQLNLITEGVNIPNKPFRALLTWQNFSRLYLRVIRLDKPLNENSVNIQDSAFQKKLLAMPVYRSAELSLPETRDLRAHRVEIPIGSLPQGVYALLASSDSSWNRKNGTLSLASFSVSSIAFINQDDDYFVLNRETGQPLSGANVQVWENNYSSGKERLEKKDVYVTDANGYFLFKRTPKDQYGTRLLEITIPGDHLFPMQAGTSYWPVRPQAGEDGDKVAFEKKHARSFIFLDRSIYRPGQTVYFKGIVVTTDQETHKPKPFSGLATRVTLLNANNEVVDSVQLTTDDFGGYHGSFRLPENQLNGEFRLAEGKGMEAFSVEEYKRPRFFVGYEKQRGSYRVGDSIRITGTVSGYAGNAIDGASVHYHITRQSHYHFSRIYGPIMPSGPGQEIAHGDLTTDATGKFSLVFYAAPDRSIARKTNPVFDFEVSADVTDINGETRSASTKIVAGYSTVRLTIGKAIEDHLPADSFSNVQIKASNLSGEPLTANVHVTIYPLQGPQRLIRQRLWQAPDRYVLSEKAWLDSFPHDEYRDETDKLSWSKGGMLLDTTLTIAGTGRPLPGGNSLTPGWYVIEAKTADRYGQEVKEVHYVELYDAPTGRPGSPQYCWNTGNEVTAEPGEKAVVTTGSSAVGVFVIRTLERDSSGMSRRAVFSRFLLDNQSKRTEWPLQEEDRGGFGVLDAFVKDNRLYMHWTRVKVPWTNKELDIQYSTFRDKTEPGSQEKWQMKISGKHGEKVSAAILTSMYDASLDQFEPHSWNIPDLYPSFSSRKDWFSWSNFNPVYSSGVEFGQFPMITYDKVYDRLLQPTTTDAFRGMVSGQEQIIPGRAVYRFSAAPVAHDMNPDVLANYMVRDRAPLAAKTSVELAEKADSPVVSVQEDSTQASLPMVQARKDFRETAFFFPVLLTDSAGNVSFSFTMPEALTTWKWLTLASSRDLSFGYSEKTVITQKELMVQPNLPRFLREGDKTELQVKVVNLTDSELTGQMSLQLTDPTTGQTADGWFVNRQPNQYFTVEPRQSFVVAFPLDIPYQYNRPLGYRIVAQARDHSDGEEGILPVVSNRMLVTESLPLNMPGDGTRSFTFDKLLKSGSSETLNNHALTVEFTANPAWYAVQSLPYLMEYPYECSEQTFERAYANALASKIASGSPRLQEEFKKWRDADTAQLLSNLQKNEELKSVLLQETPWVLQGKSEAEQKKRLALLFDIDRMSRELGSALDKLAAMQSADGGFPWFKGGPDDRYITQYILTGIGNLQKLQAIPAGFSDKVKSIVSAALPYLDAAIRSDYEHIPAAEKRAGARVGPPLQDGLHIQYLYMRSLFSDHGVPGDVFPAMSYFRKKAQQSWIQYNKYLQGMIALALYRTGDVQTARDIMASLRQNALHDEEKGMYWKGMGGGYRWYEAPVETQSLLIEAFREIVNDAEVDRELKTWLLKQKQTHSWPTTTATADACYALLIGGQDWLNEERTVEVRLGDKTISWPSDNSKQTGDAGETGIGYYKKVFDGPFVDPAMGKISVTMSGNEKTGGSPAWGAVYWQYFDMLDHITASGGAKPALSVRKRLFVQRNTDRGPVLDTIPDNGSLKPGDKVVVRMELRADREMEYVHLKDMRAACMEPVNVISQYKWQDGLGYYETTKDASTDFFFDRVPRGTYVFEYTLLVGQSGNFSNGITTVECMYAPEFSYHTEGIRVNVEAAR